jgi:UTP:GlnB (protein PII) uridylyltransferase
LRAVGAGEPPAVPFTPAGHALVTSTPQEGGRSVVRVTAPDQVGLLWAVCRWLADHQVNIEAAKVSGSGAMARDAFVVAGRFDPAALQARLSRSRPPSWARLAADLVSSVRALAGAA